MDWRSEWFEFDDVAYLNAAGQSPMPRVAVHAVQKALEWKKYPHQLPDAAYFGLPDRIRALVAQLIGGRPEEVALTTGASGGLAAVAAGLDWKPEDEVLLARGEFPAHFSTWMPLGNAGRLRVRVIEPCGRFLTADDFIAHIGPRTRLVSTSLVGFDDGARLDATRLARACHSAGAYLLLDVSQCVGAMSIEVGGLGSDFLVSAGYKWLLSPYGTGFFWARGDLIERMRVGPFYWMALEGAAEFHTLPLHQWKLAPGARRWDSPETASFLNLAAMEASLEFLLRVGVETVWEHNRWLAAEMIERLPLDRCVLASPGDPEARGPYACIAARSPEKTAALYQKLREAQVIVSLREGALRVAPHLYNTARDIDRLLAVLAV
ncbi:MAG: aminotransferase class V-fold PLP-dependent enzyme [Candidatus Acidiferrales bacterium]